jgi:hypothetical protein
MLCNKWPVPDIDNLTCLTGVLVGWFVNPVPVRPARACIRYESQNNRFGAIYGGFLNALSWNLEHLDR